MNTTIAVILGAAVGLCGALPFLIARKRGEVASGLRGVVVSFMLIVGAIFAVRVVQSGILVPFGAATALVFLAASVAFSLLG